MKSMNLIDPLFAEHPPSFDEEDYYFVSRKSDGSRFIAILNAEERTLYSLVSYM